MRPGSWFKSGVQGGVAIAGCSEQSAQANAENKWVHVPCEDLAKQPMMGRGIWQKAFRSERDLTGVDECSL